MIAASSGRASPSSSSCSPFRPGATFRRASPPKVPSRCCRKPKSSASLPVEFMKTSHMKLLLDWRDAAIRRGEREYTAPDGRRFAVSLTTTCLQPVPRSQNRFLRPLPQLRRGLAPLLGLPPGQQRPPSLCRGALRRAAIPGGHAGFRAGIRAAPEYAGEDAGLAG